MHAASKGAGCTGPAASFAGAVAAAAVRRWRPQPAHPPTRSPMCLATPVPAVASVRVSGKREETTGAAGRGGGGGDGAQGAPRGHRSSQIACTEVMEALLARIAPSGACAQHG